MRADFRIAKVKSSFRDLYLNALYERLKKTKRSRLLCGTWLKMNKAVQGGRAEQRFLTQYCHNGIKKKVLIELRRSAKYSLLLKDRERRLIAIRNRNLSLLALDAIKFFNKKSKEAKRDKLVRPFLQSDNSVWLRDQVGEPLFVFGHDDDEKYFDVNAKLENKVVGMGIHRRVDSECRIVEESAKISRGENCQINLGRYNDSNKK